MISYLQVIEVIQERNEKYLVKLTRCFVFDFTENKKNIVCSFAYNKYFSYFCSTKKEEISPHFIFQW